MTEERWQDVKGKVLDMFLDCTQGRDEDDVGVTEWVEFENKAGKRMRLEWRDQKIKLGEKTLSSKRPGSHVKIESEYSETERSQHFTAYMKDPAGEWVETDFSALL